MKDSIEFNKDIRYSALWSKYKETGDIELRNELVMLHTKIVEISARKMYHMFMGKVQLEDIIGNGMLALIKAVETFDPARNIQFDSYASIRIRGSVIDYMREQDWIPRSARDKIKHIEDACSRLRNSLGREPLCSEIADALNVEESSIEVLLGEAYTYNLLSLEEVLNDSIDGNFEIEDKENPLPQVVLLKKELKKVLGSAIDSLSEKERLVVTLFYYEGLKIKEIAEVMEVSASRVCQIHSLALIKLKARVRDYMYM
jgi:RNA polymerase sigma factor for flagellar operon FliA